LISGLWFDEYKGVCNWPAETDRQNCNAGRLSGKPLSLYP